MTKNPNLQLQIFSRTIIVLILILTMIGLIRTSQPTILRLASKIAIPHQVFYGE